MKKVFYLLLLINVVSAFGQSDIHKKAADTFLLDFNNGNYEKIFQSFTPKMKRALPREALFNFLSKVKKDIGNLRYLELYEYSEKPGISRGTYDGSFDNEIATVRITTNKHGLICGLYIKKKPIF